jgi:hypothetical protein
LTRPPAPPPAKALDGIIQLQIVGGIQLNGGQFQIQFVQPNAGAAQGTTRTVRITEGPQGIALTVTKTKGGKEVKKEFKAKNAAELEKKHPEAYKLYKDSSELLPDQSKTKK